MRSDSGPDLRRCLAGLCHPIGVDTFLRASAALPAMRSGKAAQQTGVAQCAVAVAVAGQLVEHARDAPCQGVNANLPGLRQTGGLELLRAQDGREFFPRRWRGLVVGRYVIGGKRPLRGGAERQQGYGKSEQKGSHPAQDKPRLPQSKKDGTNIFGDVRAGRPVTQLVLKLSAGGLHLNRSTRIDARPGQMLLKTATFL